LLTTSEPPESLYMGSLHRAPMLLRELLDA
jgi:hypothetical protein